MAILRAAIEEFADKGFDGARMEGVARRAGFNKALVYRYYKNKQRLFEEALREQFQWRADLRSRQPTDLGQNLGYWFAETLGNNLYVRMLMREAMHDDGSEPIEGELRRSAYAKHHEVARSYQRSGEMDTQFDPALMLLACSALVTFPVAFPQLVRLMTGTSVDSPEFTQQWDRFLKQFAAALRPRISSLDTDTQANP